MGDPNDDQSLFLTDEELARRRALAGGAPGAGQPAPGVAVASAAPPAKPAPAITLPSQSAAPAVNAGVIQPSKLNQDTNEFQRLQSTGSGVQQVQNNHHIVGGILRGLDIAGSILAPRIAANIPGTTLHHEQLLNQNRANIGQDIQEQGQEAQAAHTQAETGEIPTDTAYKQAERQHTIAATNELNNPQPKPKEEKWGEMAGFTDNDGTPLLREENSGQVVRASDKKPPVGFKPTKQERPDTPEQQFIDAETAKGIPLQKAIGDYARTTQKPPQEPGSYMPLYDEHGRVTGAWNAKTGHIAQAPQNMPGTTSQGAGIQSKADAAITKEAQPYQQMVDNATEAHQLADMAEKGNASADVDLTLSFFKMMKGAGGAGVRFTQQEQNMILGARNAGQGLVAIGQKVIGEGQPLTPEQRKNMVAVMDMHAQAARNHLAAMPHGQGGGGSPATNSKDDPFGLR